MKKIPALFGSMVFNESVMKERLTKDAYRALCRTIKEGEALDPAVADVVAWMRARSSSASYRSVTGSMDTSSLFRRRYKSRFSSST